MERESHSIDIGQKTIDREIISLSCRFQLLFISGAVVSGLWTSSLAFAELENGMAADIVLGQPDFLIFKPMGYGYNSVNLQLESR